jgi:hypothetical protein
MKDRRSKRCQHCYRGVRLMPAEEPGAPDRPVDSSGSAECIPGRPPVPHKVMPVVAS